ncbi:MAG: hypothetical protein EAZ89_01025 [Bacteroidetes bacterium]|nr:MAG: hypothetical protein EAZ89_01025 [Bacteroidota bacterium]
MEYSQNLRVSASAVCAEIEQLPTDPAARQRLNKLLWQMMNHGLDYSEAQPLRRIFLAWLKNWGRYSCSKSAYSCRNTCSRHSK